MRPARKKLIARILAVAAALAMTATVGPIGAAEPCLTPTAPMTFSEPTYVDETRAGGEPSVVSLADGTLLYGAHAGTTHFYAPQAPGEATPAFLLNYVGQVYYWWSADHGKTWTYVPRTVPANLPLTGFSDPDFAIDKAGNVYISEINLVNVAMSRSSDNGRSYTLQDPLALTISDRQWSEADEENVVYIVGNAIGGGNSTTPIGNNGHILAKSKDGGVSWSAPVADAGGLGDLQVDRSDGTLYEAHYDSGVLSMAAFRKARQDDLTPEMNTIAEGVDMLSHWPSFDVDAKGNLYIVWDETGEGESGRKAGIWYSYSKDRAKTWAKPVRVDSGPATDMWPWLAVGDEGRVGIAWFGAEMPLPREDSETSGDHGWHVYAAQTLDGLGCGNVPPRFRNARAITEAFHTGTVCAQGTVCQAQLIDRRLGDYFTIDIDSTGAMVAAYSDTRHDGAVALPAFIRQTGGPSFFAPAGSSPAPDPIAKPVAKPVVKGTKRTGGLPATGVGGVGVQALSLIVLATGLGVWRRRHS
jgi:hypothetical protein